MLQRVALALAGLVFAGAGLAQEVQWKLGTHYFRLETPVATSVPADKVEVTEVFSYGCPACFGAAADFRKIRQNLPPNAVMTYVPASWNRAEQWPLFQRAYYTAEALGVADKAHDEMFAAIWAGGPLAVMVANRPKDPPPTIEDVAKWYEKFGVKAADFVATSSSFAINTKMKRADAYIKAAQAESTPTVIVNGKYRLTVSTAGDMQKFEAVIRHLIALESAGR